MLDIDAGDDQQTYHFMGSEGESLAAGILAIIYVPTFRNHQPNLTCLNNLIPQPAPDIAKIRCRRQH